MTTGLADDLESRYTSQRPPERSVLEQESRRHWTRRAEAAAAAAAAGGALSLWSVLMGVTTTELLIPSWPTTLVAPAGAGRG